MRSLNAICAHPAIERISGNIEFASRLNCGVRLHAQKLIHSVLTCQERNARIFSVMAGDTYLFIDGEYLRKIHRQSMLDFFGVEGELDIFEAKRNAKALRAFFYDSP